MGDSRTHTPNQYYLFYIKIHFSSFLSFLSYIACAKLSMRVFRRVYAHGCNRGGGGRGVTHKSQLCSGASDNKRLEENKMYTRVYIYNRRSRLQMQSSMRSSVASLRETGKSGDTYITSDRGRPDFHFRASER